MIIPLFGSGKPPGDDEDDIVMLPDKHGGFAPFSILGIIEHDGRDFALVTPKENDSGSATNLYVLHYTEFDDGTEDFDDVTDDALFTELRAVVHEVIREVEGEY